MGFVSCALLVVTDISAKELYPFFISLLEASSSRVTVIKVLNISAVHCVQIGKALKGCSSELGGSSGARGGQRVCADRNRWAENLGALDVV